MPAARTTAVAATCLLVLLAGCDSSSPAPSAAPTPVASPMTSSVASPSATASPVASPAVSVAPSPAVDKEVVVTVAKRKVTPPTGRVEVAKGSLVRITVTSDVADELHVHGYDRSLALPAGAPASLDLRADRTGLFEVETHATHLVLFQLVVR
ncbi:hypothetical protein Daura_12405 [Dactylosporangium aurantiacum]|uniref:EfeO-type cupredoxin-like domain-containing protein n=1 Tax=Dactylosporangium aurantiacum TaxID=35754 RepID=A0A9Q9IJR9_9ACTN|nr:hypothetical protein [Dactylosporangium aurantiacum]MDG6104084.1 hypothetical protein [Dactylosporangium aurantiacum]UWZ56901.1 hypothetical protein Daura_12405 [Dactylosporangium aurantiacum]